MQALKTSGRFTMNGFSKSYAMTGWRIGFAGGPKEIISAMAALQSQTVGNVPVFLQKAAITALTAEQTNVQEMHQEFAKRRDFIIRSCLDFYTSRQAINFFRTGR